MINMCCKLPPLPSGALTLYLLLNLLFFIARALYMTGPVQIQIQSIEKCSYYEENDIILDFYINKDDKSVDANITLNFEVDDQVKVNFREKPPLPNQPLIIFINQRSFCDLSDNFLYNDPYPTESIEKTCPISKNEYYIRGLKINFALLEVPQEMMGLKTYQFELVKDEKVLLCLELDINTTKKDLAEYDQYINKYKEF